MKKQKYRHFLSKTVLSAWTLLCFVSNLAVFAQNPHPYFRNYTTDDGLPSSEVHYCLQDSKGYLWIATDNGLSRFNGYEFTNFGSREGLKHNVVFYLQEDPQGTIWAATMHGHLYFVEKDTLKAFDQNEVIENSNVQSEFVRDFYIDTSGTRYLAIPETGLLVFPPGEGHRQLIPSDPSIYLMIFRREKKWLIAWPGRPDQEIGKQTSDSIRFEMVSDSIYQTENLNVGPSGGKTWVKELKDGRLLAQATGRLLEFRGKNILEICHAPGNIDLKSLAQDKQGRILMGLPEGKGLRRYEDLEAIRENRFEEFLTGISVAHIYQDKDGGYWISSTESGIFYCPDLDLKIYDTSSGFPDAHVAALDFKGATEAFIGFRNGQILLFDLVNNQGELLPKLNREILYDLWYDSKRQELWATDGRPNVLENQEWQLIRPSNNVSSTFSKRMTISRNKELLWG